MVNKKDTPLAYKIIDNAIVIQTEDGDKNNLIKVKFKIVELTGTKLKLIINGNYEKNKDQDILELVFYNRKRNVIYNYPVKSKKSLNRVRTY